MVNRDKKQTYWQKWYNENRETILKKKRQRYYANWQKMKEAQRQYSRERNEVKPDHYKEPYARRSPLPEDCTTV